MSDTTHEHLDGRLRHRAAAGALQPQLPAADPRRTHAFANIPCALEVRDYPADAEACPECGGRMYHRSHIVNGNLHFDHECVGGCQICFRDVGTDRELRR